MSDEQLERLRELHPLIRAEAATAESDRRLTEPVVRALIEAGAMRMLAPARYHGAELDLPTWLRTVEEIAKADGSTGWCVMTSSATSSTAWFLPEEGAAEVFGEPDSVVAGTAAPIGRGEPVDGGYRVTGRWSWGSAVPHCRWVLGGASVSEGPRFMIFAAGEVTVHDTWHAAGLRATGSHDFQADGVFVPTRRALQPFTAAPTLDGPIPAFPQLSFLALGVTAVSLGIAARAVEEIEALAVTKTPQHATSRLAEQAGVQRDIATAEARLSAARAFLHDELGQCWQETLAGHEVTTERRARLRLACSHAAAEATEVARLAFAVGGGTAVFESSALQRCLRDAHVAGQHVGVSRRLFETYTRIRLGIPTDTSRL